MRQRPKVLLDIKPSHSTDVFEMRESRVNLGRKHVRDFPKRSIQAAVVLVAVSVFVVSSVRAPVGSDIFASTQDSERAELEAELAELEGQIEEYEDTISVYRQQGDSLQGEISILEAKISKISLQIKAINLSLTKLSGEINATVGKIEDVEGSIDTNKDAIAARNSCN